MSEYMWGTTTTKTSAREVTRRNRIARQIGGRGCGYVQIREPNGAWKSWFFGPNRGEPFDRQRAAEINAAVAAR